MAAADPIAQAMSALHRIEATGGGAIGEAAPTALGFVRHALAYLQTQQVTHPAVEQAMEAIASSLGIVHQLAQAGAQPPPAQPQVSPYAGTMMAEAVPQQPAPPPYQPPTPPPYPAQYQQPPPQQWQPQAAPAAAPVAAAPRVDAGGRMRVEAALGAHSATNFYKGLSGNDVIESGGIFIATYQLPTIGTELLIHVSLPGGYEFESLGVVRWTREAPQSGADSPPGFGAQFTQISQEGRQLVYRYVRNREPLFHDDL